MKLPVLNISDFLYEHISPIMEAVGSPTTDNAILFKIGEHKFKWMSKFKSVRERVINKYNIRGAHYRAGIISFAKDSLPHLMKNSEELISRDQWDLDGLIGETEYQLMHPHYCTINDWVLKNHKPKSKILTIFECSNSKPYSTQMVRDKYYCKWFRAFTDMACISNPGVVPLEYSHFYPYRYDEWNHFAEEEDIVEKYTYVSISRVLEYKRTMGYTDIIIVMQSRHSQKWAEKMYNENIGGARSWMRIVNDEAHYDDFIKRSERKFGKTGIKIQRLVQQDFFIDRYVRLLRDCLNESGRKELDRVLKIKQLDNKRDRANQLAGFNKEHDIEPYDITTGTKDSVSVYTFEETSTVTQVEQDITYIKSQLKEAKEHLEEAKENKDWHKYRIVFTPLDLLMDKHDNKIIEDVDKEYANMYQAVHKVANNNSNIRQLNDYCFCLEDLVQEIGIKEVKKYCNKLGLTQFNDERRRHPDK